MWTCAQSRAMNVPETATPSSSLLHLQDMSVFLLPSKIFFLSESEARPMTDAAPAIRGAMA